MQWAAASREPVAYRRQIFLAPAGTNRKVPHHVGDSRTGAADSAG
jgi:hypothetical protein